MGYSDHIRRRQEETVSEARDRFRQAGEGAACPCCDRRRSKIYTRILSHGMAWMLIRLCHITEDTAPAGGWIHISRHFLRQQHIDGKLFSDAASHEYSKLRFWGLLEQSTESGFWRVTDRGKQFILGRLSVPRISYVADNQLLSQSDDLTDVHRALGDHFDYEELMNASRTD